MLRSFRLENHRSFEGEAELSLLSAYGKSPRQVPVAAIYGANAAGKSNLLDGLRYMRDAVTHSFRVWSPEGGVPRSPYRLSSAQLRPSTYVAELVLSETRYVYGFVLDDEVILEEWLHSFPKGRRRVLFERDGMSITVGDSVAGSRARFEAIQELTRANALFLSLAAQVNLKPLMEVFDWFSGIQWPGPQSEDALAGIINAQESRARERLITLLRAADLGIDDVAVQLEDIDQVEKRGDYLLRKPRREVQFRHGEELFEWLEESAGTRAWLWYLPSALHVLTAGGVLAIDEIDASLHPNLTAFLIRQFQSPQINPQGAQLVFTTHDASLLGTSFGDELLKRDQIWFVEKDAGGASRLYPLTDFHPRTGENRERRYLGGSYGGVPVLGSSDLGLTASG